MNVLSVAQCQTIPLSVQPKIDVAKLAEKTLSPTASSILRISSLLRDINASTRKITAAVCYEPMLVTRILRLANSPIYGLERKITSIQSAIDTIGLQRLQEMATMLLAASAFDKQISDSILAREIWEHSLAVAIIARELAAMSRMQGVEEAFTCGLLHDIGKLLLLSHDVEGFSAILGESDEARMLELERASYGYSHDEIGGLVARHWELQEEICSTIALHHDPSAAEHPMMVAYILNAADTIANVKGYGGRPEEEHKLWESEALMKLKFSPEDVDAAWEKVQSNIDEAIKTFY